MNTLFRNFNTLPVFFNEYLADSAYSPSTVPSANILEHEDEFQISLAAPGYQKEDFKVEITEKTLKISVQKEQNEEESVGKKLRQEYSFQNFTRTFRLPNTVDTSNIAAQYNQGLLTLVIPKREEAKPKEPRVLEIA
ncbi:MAG: Hsp20/alpha crystallin family protein [Leadbetterella sp.]